MPATKNLCAQISLELHQKISEAREESGLTTAQYITQLLTEYYEMKENGGNSCKNVMASPPLPLEYRFQVRRSLMRMLSISLVVW